MKHESAFALAEKVIIDGDRTIVAVVTAILFRTWGTRYELSYFSDKGHEEIWIDEWRISKWEE